MDMEKDGVCKTDRQNKKCSCGRKSWSRKNNVETHKAEENKLTGPLAKKKLPAAGCSRTGVFNPRPGKGKREESSRQKISDMDNFMKNGQYEDRKRKAENRVRRRRLSLQ